MPGQSEPGSNDTQGMPRIYQSSGISETLSSDYLVSDLENSFGVGSYPSAEQQSVYSTAPADSS